MPKLALWAQTVDIAGLPLRQDVLAKNALMPAQRDFGLGNSPIRIDKWELLSLNIEGYPPGKELDLLRAAAWSLASDERIPTISRPY